MFNDVYASNVSNTDDVIAISETEAVIPTEKGNDYLSHLSGFVPMILIFVVLYFFLLRPQEKRRKQQETLLNSLKKGEEVVTQGGIYGMVSKINDDGTVVLAISDSTEIKILRSSIAEIVNRSLSNDTTTQLTEQSSNKDKLAHKKGRTKGVKN